MGKGPVAAYESPVIVVGKGLVGRGDFSVLC